MNFRKLNIAEAFSFIRIVSFPVVLLFIFLNQRDITAWLYIILFSTDFIDGVFAHFFGKESSRRMKMDSYGDIFFLIVGVIGLYVFEKEFFVEYLSLILLVIGGFTLQLLISLLKFNQPTNFHTILARIATIFQVLFLTWMFFSAPVPLLFYLTVIFSLLEVVEEILITFILKEPKDNIYGIWHWKRIKD